MNPTDADKSIKNLPETTDKSQSWLEKNVCHPAWEAAVSGLYQPTANAINLLPQAITGKDWLPKITVDTSHDEAPADTGEYLSRLLVHGAIGAFAYTAYGRLTGGLLRKGTRLAKLEGRAANFFGSESSGQIAGAAVHDALIDAPDFQNRTANIASGVASFGVFELLNRSIGKQHWITRAIAHAPIGFAGGMTGYLTREGVAGRELDYKTGFQSAVDGAALNVFLPAMQWTSGKALDIVADKRGKSIPLERHANYENLKGKSSTLDTLMRMFPTTRVTRSAEEGAAIDHKHDTVHVMPKSPADHLAHELAHKLAVKKFEKDIQYAAGLLKYNEKFAKQSYVDARVKQEQFARETQLQAAKELLLADNPRAKVPRPEPSHIMPIYERMFEMEFDQHFKPSKGKWRPEEDFISSDIFAKRLQELSDSGQLISNELARRIYKEIPDGDDGLEQLANFMAAKKINAPRARWLAMQVQYGQAGYRPKPSQEDSTGPQVVLVTRNGNEVPFEYEFSDTKFDRLTAKAVMDEKFARELAEIDAGFRIGQQDSFDEYVMPIWLHEWGMRTKEEAALYAINRDGLNEHRLTIDKQIELAKLAASRGIPAEEIPSLYELCKDAWSVNSDIPAALALKLGKLSEPQQAAVLHSWWKTLLDFGKLDNWYQPTYPKKLLHDASFASAFWNRYEQLSQLKYSQQFKKSTIGLPRDRHILLELATKFHHKDLLTREETDRMVGALDAMPASQRYGIISSLKAKSFKNALEHLSSSRKDSSDHQWETWEERSALGLSLTFGNAWSNWLSMQSKLGRSEHDSTYWLPITDAANLKGLARTLEQNHTSPIRQLELIAYNWPKLPKEIHGKSFDEIIEYCSPATYQNIRSNKFAREAAGWQLAEYQYPYWEDIYIKSLNVPTPFPLERNWQSGNLTGRFLPRADERGLFLGMHTNCCQHPTGAGSDCAKYGQLNRKSGFFVVENRIGEIVAQAWVWMGEKGGLCFDNIEAKGLGKQNEQVVDILKQVGSDLKSQFGPITLGTSGDLQNIPWEPAGKSTLTPPEDYSGYRDSYKQVLIDH